jgi:hypothetical protein
MLVTIKSFVENYKDRLLNDESNLRNKFIIKMDDIAGLKHVWYFVYGSNLLEEQLISRLSKIDENFLQRERCFLKGYEFTYNKRSCDGSSKANLIKSGNVEGVAILILENKLVEFIEKYEQGYLKTEIQIQTKNNTNKNPQFTAYTCISDNITSASPTYDYVSKIIKGAHEKNLPLEYIEKYLEY